jgi:hypothetical protein
MSIIESLTKLVDPVLAQQREEERRKDREQPQRNDAGAPPRQFRCRVCGHEDGEGAYCPTCLADTMEPVPPARAPK